MRSQQTKVSSICANWNGFEEYEVCRERPSKVSGWVWPGRMAEETCVEGVGSRGESSQEYRKVSGFIMSLCLS